MSRILVTYATMAGSTAEVAQAIAEQFTKSGVQADVLPLSQIKDIKSYAGVVVGAPMIMGWHRSALGFLRKHRRALQHVPLAVFITAMSLTRTADTNVEGISIFVDENLPKPPAKENSLSFRERYATLPNYLRPILRATRPAKPASVAIFGGKLEYGRLKWWAVLFAMLIIQAQPGEKRNWPAIQAWASSILPAFQPEVK
ncbi:MAG: flavodoxin domain-containing protein [Anaerolineales bacterium]|nr:flavodoxin domain-containing protein [Anaerolineales bacterium]